MIVKSYHRSDANYSWCQTERITMMYRDCLVDKRRSAVLAHVLRDMSPWNFDIWFEKNNRMKEGKTDLEYRRKCTKQSIQIAETISVSLRLEHDPIWSWQHTIYMCSNDDKWILLDRLWLIGGGKEKKGKMKFATFEENVIINESTTIETSRPFKSIRLFFSSLLSINMTQSTTRPKRTVIYWENAKKLLVFFRFFSAKIVWPSTFILQHESFSRLKYIFGR